MKKIQLIKYRCFDLTCTNNAGIIFFGIILLHGIMEPLSGIPKASSHGGEEENQDAYLSGRTGFEGK